MLDQYNLHISIDAYFFKGSYSDLMQTVFKFIFSLCIYSAYAKQQRNTRNNYLFSYFFCKYENGMTPGQAQVE
jgi:hypothetical protein